MPTLLLTGFEPFHTHPVNPSAEAAQSLDGLALGGLEGGGVRVQSALLPVEPYAAGEALRALLGTHRPDAVLLTGLAAGRPQVTLERVALNVMDFVIPDNAGQTYRDAPACPDAPAPAAYLSTLPLREVLAAWREAGIPGDISNTAGLYVCNYVLYHALHTLARAGRAHVPCGFLHVPANPEVALAVPGDRPALPYLPQGEITRAVRVAAETLARRLERVAYAGGRSRPSLS
ncbi:pyroglutamyl-peptidase I [Deinococcus budaensis]|uniref:Pyroglutamyl-peptidase I n=1 Tax=Deinococcus budaensis TaxID=1665626 RepID=A0A7W8GGS8_9DEIO|nr:pyroglutamyl-peptidase I [Deinococcus budaensis]MBB5234953.1 pyroglutamyl-peptidase [Deinococcus budaensis]